MSFTSIADIEQRALQSGLVGQKMYYARALDKARRQKDHAAGEVARFDEEAAEAEAAAAAARESLDEKAAYLANLNAAYSKFLANTTASPVAVSDEQMAPAAGAVAVADPPPVAPAPAPEVATVEEVAAPAPEVATVEEVVAPAAVAAAAVVSSSRSVLDAALERRRLVRNEYIAVCNQPAASYDARQQKERACWRAQKAVERARAKMETASAQQRELMVV